MTLLPTPVADNSRGLPSSTTTYSSLPNAVTSLDEINWGPYAAAIARWERVTGRPAPSPTEPGEKNRPRLSARFVEWMMGLPDGWVTDVSGISRTAKLKACGNGVVPQQAYAALAHMLEA